MDDQALLAEHAEQASLAQGVPVLISNHDTPYTRRLYRGASFNVVKVKRTISRNGNGRNKVDELLALFSPHATPRLKRCCLKALTSTSSRSPAARQ